MSDYEHSNVVAISESIPNELKQVIVTKLSCDEINKLIEDGWKIVKFEHFGNTIIDVTLSKTEARERI